MITVQAPQLPLLQPSLAPVRRRFSRNTSRRLCRGSQRNSAASPLTVVETWSFFEAIVILVSRDQTWSRRCCQILLPAGQCPLRSLCQGSFDEHTYQMHPIFGCAPHVGDWRSDFFGQQASLDERFFGGRLAGEPLRGLSRRFWRRRHGAEANSRSLDGFAIA